MNKLIKISSIFILTIICITSLSFILFSNPSNLLLGAETGDDLWNRGYTVLPEPQKVEVNGGDFTFGSDWGLELSSGVTEQHIAVKTLLERLKVDSGINLSISKSGYNLNKKAIQLEIRPGCAALGKKDELARQGYILELKPDKILISGNDNPGLLYGVQTLLQLLSSKKENTLPVCKIEDWPDLELRIIHWCEKHHQNRIKTLKDYIDRAVEYKINGIGWQLEDRFAYERHPVIGIPGAFTKKQVREIDKYARERYIELIPLVDCPAHMAYVLKHPEFAHLREFVNNNYQMCPYNEKAWDLIYDMFDEIMEAFSSKYFHVSTDEAYYLGDGVECGCVEKKKEIGKSGIFVEFVNRAVKYLEDRGKEVMCWGESPLRYSDIPKLPNTLIDAVVNDRSKSGIRELEAERDHGIRVVIYVSIHGGGLFTDYFQRVKSVNESISFGRVRKINDVLGTFVAGWDDSGPHDEVFWLGWVGATSYAWHGGVPEPDILSSKFMKLFYGPEATDMKEIYTLLNESMGYPRWGRRSLASVKPGLGNSYGIYEIPRPRGIGHIELPNLPDTETLFNHPFWKDLYRENLEILDKKKEENAHLIELLNDNLNKAQKNRYNLEVMLSLAKMRRHNINLFETLAVIEDTLSSAAKNYLDYDNAVSCLEAAIKLAEDICNERERYYQQLKKVWEVSRYPKGRIVDGRKFVHILDDIKNHSADVTPDLSYIILSERNLNIERWIYDLKGILQTFVLRHQYKK